MRSAQRRYRLKRNQEKNNIFFVVKLLVIPAVLLLAFLLIKITSRFWNGTDKFAYAYKIANGDVAVTIDDPKGSEETTLIIPGDTQVTVSGSYGVLRIKNVWQLSMNEKLGGALLPRSITRDLYFPVFLWADSDAVNLKDGNFLGIVKFIFSPKHTNIPIGDRLSLGFYAMQVKSIDKTEINLGTSKFLQKTVLNDGEPGYLVGNALSQRLTVYFADEDFGKGGGVRVEIKDATGVPGVADTAGQVIQVMGGKVVTIDKEPSPQSIDCLVLGKDPKIVSKITNLFNCKKGTGNTDFDLELQLGTGFAKKF